MPEVLPIPRCGEHRQCLACAFPFWDKLTADQQELLCRATRKSSPGLSSGLLLNSNRPR